MAWLETDRLGRLRIAFKYYDGRTYRQMGHRNLTMLIRHYWRWINPGELSQETLARLGTSTIRQINPTSTPPRQRGRFARGLTTMLDAKKCRNLAEREGFEPSVPGKGYARLATSPPTASNRAPARLFETQQGLMKYELLRRRSSKLRLSLAESHSLRKVFPSLAPPETNRRIR